MTSSSATLASRQWQDDVATLPVAAQGPASGLEELVIGGQGGVVGQIAGPEAQQHALEAFVTGVQGAMWVGAALTFAAALTAFIGLRGTPSPRDTERPAEVETAMEGVPA